MLYGSSEGRQAQRSGLDINDADFEEIDTQEIDSILIE